MNLKITVAVLSLIVLNILPITALYFELIPKNYILYFYWAESAVFGILTIFLYAKHLLVFFLLLGFALLILNIIDIHIWNETKTQITFWSLYSLGWLFYFEIGKSSFGLWMKRLNPFKRFLFYLTYMALTITICTFITLTVYNQWSLFNQLPLKIYIIIFSLIFTIPTLSISFLRIIDMIGANHFIHFLFGTYHRPIEKQAIVMFLDMEGSSAMAEKLKARRAMALIARFIFDASATFRMYGGDILNYTGDGLVLLWPVTKADKAIASVEALQSRLENNKQKYIKEFGIMPDFRIGLHAGKVIISQIGEEKLFLGLYGDVVNTASRLESMNKELGTKIIFSNDVKRRLSLERQACVKALGLKEIRGRDGKIKVFTLKNNLKPIKSNAQE